tara:strand:- start:833 stop:2446 length:1614 start_codon:yes stop_codon:yes gene_type:complete
MNGKIIVIGLVIGKSNGNIDLSYPSSVGIRNVSIPEGAVLRQERITNNRVALQLQSVDGFNVLDRFAGSAAPYHVTQEHIDIVNSFENNEDIEDYIDDETPDFSGVESMALETTPVVILQGEQGPVVPESDADVWGAGLFSGNRNTKACNWRFTPVKRPAFVFTDELNGGSMAPTAAAVNKADGTPAAYHIFNPDFADNKRPMGAYLGTFSDQYFEGEGYPEKIDPLFKLAEKHGWKMDATAYKEGKKLRVDCNVAQAGVTKSLTRDRMTGISKMFSDDVTAPVVDSLKNLYRYGFTIHDSLDGSSSFKVRATAMRGACANMQMFDTATRTIMMKRHTKGEMQGYNWEEFGENLNEIILAAQQELVAVEMLKNVAVSDDLLERIMTLSERKGIITKPKVHRDVETKEVTKLSSGHMWRLMGHGWTNPKESWVKVDEEDEGTLFHVYNILTGALTHKPTYNDFENKSVMQGNTLGFDTLDKKLVATHNMLKEIGEQAIGKFHATKNVEIGADQFDELKQFTSSLDMLEHVPLFSEVLV